MCYRERGNLMQFNSYEEFLNTEEWKQVAEMVKERDGHKCVICGSTENLNAHHIGYEGDYLNEDDIVTLCRRCHECLHDGLNEIRKATRSGVRKMLGDVLSDVVVDFYKRSFTKGDGDFEVCNHDNFLKLSEILEKSIHRQITEYGHIADLPSVLYNVYYENRSKEKIIGARVDYIERALKVGMKPWEIQERLKINDKQYAKLIKKIGESNGQ